MAFESQGPLKGRLTVLERQIVKLFMFNPNKITDNQPVSYGFSDVAGISHPAAQYGAGGKRSIGFELHIDGDRGLIGRGGDSQSIKDELDFYRSLKFPSNYDQLGFTSVYPFMVLFSFGELYQQLPCLVTKADATITAWAGDLTPIRATVAMELTEHITRSQTSNEVFPGGF